MKRRYTQKYEAKIFMSLEKAKMEMEPTKSHGEIKNLYLSAARKNDVHPSTRVLAMTAASEDSTPELLASLSCWVLAARGYALKIALIWSEKGMNYYSYKTGVQNLMLSFFKQEHQALYKVVIQESYKFVNYASWKTFNHCG